MAAPIPPDVLKKLKADPFMKTCCVCGATPQWHHQIISAGKSLNKAWAILPLCAAHHRSVNRRKIHQLMDWVVLNRATDSEIEACSSIMNYKARKKWLNKQYGEFCSKKIAQYHEDISNQD